MKDELTSDKKANCFRVYFLTIPLFLLLWEGISNSGIFSIKLFPPPSVVFQTLVEMLLSGELLRDVMMSLQRVIIGFLTGSFLGVFVGLLTGRVKMLSSSLGQLIQIFRPIPSIAFVPLTIVWFGLGEGAKYFLITWGVFFPVWMNTHLGVLKIDTVLLWAARSLGASKERVFFEVVLPAAIPFIMAGARIGLAIAFICLIAAEMAGAFYGIGYRISASHLVFRVDKMMAAIAVLGTLGAVSDMLFSIVANKLIPWYATNEQ